MKLGYGEYFIEMTVEDVRELGGLMSRLRVPKNRPNKIGIVVAIRTENNKDKLRLENDLVSGLIRGLQKSDTDSRFNVIKFPEFLSRKIHDSKDAHLYLNRARAHMMVFGQLVERNIDGTNSYVFRLQGSVRHIPIAEQVKGALAADFSASLPSRVAFPEDKEVLGFDLTEEFIRFAVKFIIGSAALVSRDFALAQSLFEEVKTELEEIYKTRTNPILAEIYKRNRLRLIEAIISKLRLIFSDYEMTRDVEKIFRAESLTKDLVALDEGNYFGRTALAIISYKRGDIPHAEAMLKGIDSPDAMTKYNLGFLSAVKGELAEALTLYRKASNHVVNPAALNELDLFTTEQLVEHPGLVQLYFFRGYINYKAKGDFLSAKQDFERFLRETENRSGFERLSELSKRYLEQLSRTA